MVDLGDDLYGINVTSRGFRHLPPIPGAYGGTVRVYESSSAESPHVWLAVASPDGDEMTHHLTADAALRLARHLQWLVENHYQRVPAGRDAAGEQGER